MKPTIAIIFCAAGLAGCSKETWDNWRIEHGLTRSDRATDSEYAADTRSDTPNVNISNLPNPEPPQMQSGMADYDSMGRPYIPGESRSSPQTAPSYQTTPQTARAQTYQPTEPRPQTALRTDRDRTPDRTMPPAAPGEESSECMILSLLHAANQEEIRIGRLAQDKGGRQEVKDFGAKLQRDHSDNDKRVNDIAQKSSTTLKDPAEFDRADKKPKEDMESQLRAVTGPEFDRLFAEKMERAHRELILKLEDAQTSITNPAVKNLVNETLPILRGHREQAQQLR